MTNSCGLICEQTLSIDPDAHGRCLLRNGCGRRLERMRVMLLGMFERDIAVLEISPDELRIAIRRIPQPAAARYPAYDGAARRHRHVAAADRRLAVDEQLAVRPVAAAEQSVYGKIET